MLRSGFLVLFVAFIALLAPITDPAAGDEVLLQDVPAYDWTHGCSPTAGMILWGYWDNYGYSNLIPGSNNWDQNGGTIRSAIASSGHLSDYAKYGGKYDEEDNIITDMSEINPGGAHPDDCLADFMRTSRSVFDLWHGATSSSRIGPGMENYASWRGHSFSAGGDYYSMPSWADFIREIQCGRPVKLGVDVKDSDETEMEPHSVTAIGYRTTNGYQEYACRDTWSSDYYDVRWERFRPFSTEYKWGIYGWDSFSPSDQTHDTVWGVGSGNWNASSSWDNGVPSVTAFTYIPAGGQADVTAPGAAQFINNYGQITVSDSLQVGTIRNTGSIRLFQGDSSLTVQKLVRNFGSITQSAGSVNVAGSVFIQKDASYRLTGGQAAFGNLEIHRGGRFEWFAGTLTTQDIKANITDKPYTEVRPLLAIGFDFNPVALSSGAIFGGSNFSFGETGLVEITNGAQANHTSGSAAFREIRVGSESGSGTYLISGAGASLIYDEMTLGDGGYGHFGQTAGYVGRDSDRNWDGETILGRKAGSVGIYEIEDGEWRTFWLRIGYSGKGVVKQTSGTVTNSSQMWLGYNPGAEGIYEISGGQLNVSSDSINVGYEGKGVFKQSGGTVEVNDLMVGFYRSAIGTYELSAGEVIANDDVSVGYFGLGLFRQTGGSNTVSGGLSLGCSYGSYGTYELIDGDLSTYSVSVGGEGGIGLFEQTGGTHTITGGLTLAYSEGSHGTYKLNSGQLSSQSLNVGWGGLFVQNAGTFSVAQSLSINDYGHFKLNDGQLSAGQVWLGSEGDGRLTQAGGTCNVNGLFYIRGIFELSEGQFTCDEMTHNRGHVLQTGGTATVTSDMTIGYNSDYIPVYDLNGGVLSVGGTCRVDGVMNIAGGSASFGTFRVGGGEVNMETAGSYLEVGSKLKFDWNAKFSAAPGSAIHMTGAAFENYSKDSDNLAGLENLTLIFEGGSEDVDPFQVAGEDMGATMAGFGNNFALGTLQLGGDAGIGLIRLVDYYDNQQDGGGNEALYVHNFIINPDSYIELNGLNLYYLNDGQIKQFFYGDFDLSGEVDRDDLAIFLGAYDTAEPYLADMDRDGDCDRDDLAIFLGAYGSHTEVIAGYEGHVPEPATLSLLAFGFLGLLRRKRR